MKGSIKLLAASLLTGALVVNGVIPALSQGYQNYNYGNYSTTPSYTQIQTPNYQTNYQPNYQQSYQTQQQQSYQAQQQPNYSYNQNSNYLPPLQGRIMLPVGAQLPATISSPISSGFARIGDTVAAVIGSDISAGGAVIIPAGSRVEGKVIDAIGAGRFGGNGRLNIRFNTAITPNGKRYPISGKIATEDGTGILIGGTTTGKLMQAAKNTAIGAGAGAALGTAMGAIAGGRPGKGAWSGTAIGGGLGLLSNFVTKGQEAIIPGNTRVDIILDQDLIDSGSPYGY